MLARNDSQSPATGVSTSNVHNFMQFSVFFDRLSLSY